jgi:site-specific DNA-methyltransferase (adenine-specific)
MDFKSKDNNFVLYNNDCNVVLSDLISNSRKVDLVFADAPYFLSGDGTTCKSGKRAAVSKGKWDQKLSIQKMHQFNKEWLKKCREVLHDDGTIWVCGNKNNVFSVGMAMQELGFRILNSVTFQKVNPPPNLACRCFTHSTEMVIWAAKSHDSKYTFNYADMKKENGGKQMKDVWPMTPPKKSEKICGKHPTQKPITLLDRIIRASTNPGDTILDPFSGSGTTGISAYGLDRKFIGIELEKEYFDLTVRRFNEQFKEEDDGDEEAVQTNSEEPSEKNIQSTSKGNS